MGLLVKLLTFPALGPVKMLHWLATVIEDEAEREMLDEGGVRGALLELQQRYDAGAIAEEAYDEQERGLLERLGEIRKLKAQRVARS